MSDKVLLLGSTGKMGKAILRVFEKDYVVKCRNRSNFDAADFDQVRSVVEETMPKIVINTIAYMGIEQCERDPEKALRMNTLYPKLLAELSNDGGFLLVHFSTDAVFNDAKRDFYVESDVPCPVSIYGLTKYGADCFIQAIAHKYYIFRIPVLFGETGNNNQFVEKMMIRIMSGERIIRVSDDIILSPTYSNDVAEQVKTMIESACEPGVYHISNEGKASLFDLMKEIIMDMGLGATVERASYMEFPSKGIKNTFTPMKSEKVMALRPWEDAVRAYCNSLKKAKRQYD